MWASSARIYVRYDSAKIGGSPNAIGRQYTNATLSFNEPRIVRNATGAVEVDYCWIFVIPSLGSSSDVMQLSPAFRFRP